VVEVLRQLARRLLAREAGVSASVQGEVFGDTALHQVGAGAALALRRGCCRGLLPWAPWAGVCVAGQSKH
jgi:hypothetical protein